MFIKFPLLLFFTMGRNVLIIASVVMMLRLYGSCKHVLFALIVFSVAYSFSEALYGSSDGGRRRGLFAVL